MGGARASHLQVHALFRNKADSTVAQDLTQDAAFEGANALCADSLSRTRERSVLQARPHHHHRTAQDNANIQKHSERIDREI